MIEQRAQSQRIDVLAVHPLTKTTALDFDMQNRILRSGVPKLSIFAAVLALIAPLLVVGAPFLDRYNLSARLHQELEVRHKALGIAREVDQHFARLASVAQTLAASPSIANGDLAAFRQHALHVRNLQQIEVTVSTLEGLPVVSTRSPVDGAASPVDATLLQNLLKKKASLMVSAGLNGEMASDAFSLITPVYRSGTSDITHVLALHIPMTRIQEIADRTETPGWAVSILDSRGLKLVRTKGVDELVNRPSITTDLEKSVGDWSVWQGVGKGDRQIFVGYARTQLAGWLVAVDVPATELQRRQYRAHRDLLITGLLAALASLALGIWALRRISTQA